MQKINFKFEIFEGPLDLLLHLIRKNKLNIYDIEISKLLDQYLEYINEMKNQDLEVSSEFLEMAAKLIYIKTASLLPKSEEKEVLKEELTGRLLELELIKTISVNLSERSLYGKIFSRKPLKIDVDKTYNGVHNKNELISAYLNVVDRNKSTNANNDAVFTDIVEKRIVSITSRVVYVLRKLYKDEKISYCDFFNYENKSERIATFLAILELVKSKRIYLTSDNKFICFKKS